jgi:hypothetical protein
MLIACHAVALAKAGQLLFVHSTLPNLRRLAFGAQQQRD